MNVVSKKPDLFERTDCNIWTDPYLQQQMLKKHLDPLSDAASRRPESILKIVDFMSRHIKPGGCALDLGCGPGLYTSLLRDRGYTVTGMDFSRTSIEYAAGKQKDIQYILGDYTKDYPVGVYDGISMIYCDLGTHPDSDRDRLLKDICNSLNDGGVFIFDVFSERITDDRKESRDWEYAPSGGFWSKDEYLLLKQVFHYPEDKAYAYQYNLMAKDTDKHFIVWERYYSEEEITMILKSIGFRKVSIVKNLLDGNNFTSSCEMFVVAGK